MNFSFQTLFDAFNMINSIMMPTGNLGISRAMMPQIPASIQTEYIKWLNDKDIKTTKASIRVMSLMLTQNEINKTKVFKIMQAIRGGKTIGWSPIIVSRDGFVIDGSHRFIAAYNIDRYSNIDCIKVNLDALSIVKLTKSFGRAHYRNNSDAKISK